MWILSCYVYYAIVMRCTSFLFAIHLMVEVDNTHIKEGNTHAYR
jgi:hypothetical protein